MRILHLIPSLAIQTGGPPVMVTELVTALAEHSIVSRVMTTDLLTPIQAREMVAGADIGDFPSGAKALDIQVHRVRQPYRLCYSSSLRTALMNQAPAFNVIHIHSVNLFPQFAAWRAARRHNIPYIVTPHGALDPWIRGKRRFLKQTNDLLWQRRMLDGAAAIHLTTEDERTLIEPLHIRAPQIVVPNGLDIAKFARRGNGELFRDLWLDGYSGALILNHGRLSKKKGLDILVESLALLRRSEEVRLALVGADDEGIGDALRARADELGLSNAFIIVPPLSGEELDNAIAAADVWVLPSHSENFGLAVAEAMAANRSIVTSPHVNIAPDAAKADALIMVPNTPESVAHALRGLLRSPERRAHLGRNANLYVQRYAWSNVIPDYIALYESAIASKQIKR